MATKKQHYVPKLLLRGFANRVGEEFRLNVYDIERDHYRQNQKISEVCSGNYTYDKDNTFEHFLSDHIETPFGSDLSEMVKSPQRTSPFPSDNLLRFLLVQLARTRQAFNSNMESMNGMMQTVFAETAKLNNMDPTSVERLEIGPSEPRSVLAYLAAYAATQYKLLADLHLSILVNETNDEFIVSDHPVFQHNWYLRNSTELLANGITVRGVQFFLPITSTLTVCLYDPSVYVYRGSQKGVAITVTLSDVATLNSFQALNASELLVARSEKTAQTLVDLGRRYSEQNSFTSEASNSEPTDDGCGRVRSTHIVVRRQARLPSMPSFVKIKNKVRRAPLDCRHRQPEVVLAHEALTKAMDRVRNE